MINIIYKKNQYFNNKFLKCSFESFDCQTLLEPGSLADFQCRLNSIRKPLKKAQYIMPRMYMVIHNGCLQNQRHYIIKRRLQSVVENDLSIFQNIFLRVISIDPVVQIKISMQIVTLYDKIVV